MRIFIKDEYNCYQNGLLNSPMNYFKQFWKKIMLKSVSQHSINIKIRVDSINDTVIIYEAGNVNSFDATLG